MALRGAHSTKQTNALKSHFPLSHNGKPWANDTWLTNLEYIGSLRDGDGTLRPSVSWQVSDSLNVSAGADIIWGRQDGIIGQFDDRDRAWVKASWAI
ncbi:MAG: hypothetical protein AAGJ84_12585 [Pseudomonadota bacterium]